MSEQYSNLGSSTTTGTIDASTNPFSIPVASVSSFPATFPFRVTVCDTAGTNAEVMLVIGASTGTLTATRSTGIGNVAAAEVPVPTLSTHSSGSIVSHNLTAGAMSQIALQASPLFTAPTGLTLHDGIGGAVLSTDFYGLTLNVPNASGNNVIYCSTALAHSTYTAVFGFRGAMVNGNFAQVGPMITDGTKIVTWRWNNQNTQDIYYWTSFNSPSASQMSTSLQMWGQAGIICKIVQDATHRTYYVGDYRLRQFIQIYQEAANNNLTETAVGFFGLASNSFSVLCEGFHLTIQ